jgi:DNA polymerase (family 10)
MRNSELARALDRIADLLELDEADGFRVNTYRRTARTIRGVTEDIAVVAAENRLTDLPGIGKSTAQKIQQFVTTGHIDVLDELDAKYPPGLSRLMQIPGMGPKKAALVHSQLGVTDVEGLKRIIASGELEKLPGLGAATVKKIAEGLKFQESFGERTPLGIALPVAEVFAQKIRELPGVARAEIAGSLRRGMETIGDIDILCAACPCEPVLQAFIKFHGVKNVLAAGPTKASVVAEMENGREIQIDLRAVENESYGAALQYFTGSKEHSVRLRERAIARMWSLNEYGLWDGKIRVAGAEEEEIYSKLGLPFIPPEIREDRGEFDLKSTPQLVTLADIHGDLHLHTKASDGRFTIEEMAVAARGLGYAYIAVCDHSKSSTIANGLTIERMREHLDAIREADKRIDGIGILAGCECDILPDGSMDYPDEILAACDWVVASIHSGITRTTKGLSPTDRTLAAIENRWVSAIGHPTGRLIHERPAMEIDMDAVVKAAARTGTILEINANWHRLDLKDVHARQALAAGVDLVINTDAHHMEEYRQMRYGVFTARRAGATPGRVVNCLSQNDLRKRIARKRDGELLHSKAGLFQP